MSNPHKPWARIDSRLQRQLGHYAHYGMPTDSSSTAIHTLIGSPSDTVPEIDYGIRHIPANDPFFSAFPNYLRGISLQDGRGIWGNPDIELLSARNAQVPRNTVPMYETEQQPITTFKEGFKQSLKRLANNAKYNYGQFMRKRSHEDDIRNGLRHLDQNPELDRNNIQQINWSIRSLRKDIAERRKRIEDQIGTEEDEQAISRNSDMIRALYAMQKQYYKGATTEEAEDWRNEYIAKGSTGTQEMHNAVEREKSFRPTKGMGTFGEITGNVITEAPLIAGSVIGAAPIGVVAGTASLANTAFNNLAQSNIQADILEERTGQEISTARRLGQATLGTGADMIASKILPGQSTQISKPFLRRMIQDISSQSLGNTASSLIKDIGQNEILGDNLSTGEILTNAGRSGLIGGLTGGAVSGTGHMANKIQKNRFYPRKTHGKQNFQLLDSNIPSIIQNETYRSGIPFSPDIDPNAQTIIGNGTYYRERPELPPATYRSQIPFPEDIDPNARTIIENGTYYRERPELPPIERNAIDMDNLNEGLKTNSHPQITEGDDIVIRTPFGIYESMFGIDKLKEIGDLDQKSKIPFMRHESRLWKKKKK